MSDWLHKLGAKVEDLFQHDDPAPAAATPAPSAPPGRAAASTPATGAASAMDVRAAIGRIDRGGPDEREYMEATDGFVAFDRSGALAGGRLPGARTRAQLLPGRSDGVMEILAHGDSRNPVTFRVAGGAPVSGGRTNGDGDATLPAAALAGAFARVDPRRGGLVPVEGESPMGHVRSQMLALPSDYDGPIFVSDIDDTLRDTSIGDVLEGKTQPPIPGAREILSDVAAQGVPIVYLSAGTSKIRAQNRRFLDQMPPGVLLDKKDFGIRDLDPRNSAQARGQAEYKTATLRELKAAYPNAKLFGLGDDKYGDAIAYTNVGAKAYVNDVREGDANIPSAFRGTIARGWDPRTRASIHADLAAAVAGSRSFR